MLEEEEHRAVEGHAGAALDEVLADMAARGIERNEFTEAALSRPATKRSARSTLRPRNTSSESATQIV